MSTTRRPPPSPPPCAVGNGGDENDCSINNMLMALYNISFPVMLVTVQK